MLHMQHEIGRLNRVAAGDGDPRWRGVGLQEFFFREHLHRRGCEFGQPRNIGFICLAEVEVHHEGSWSP